MQIGKWFAKKRLLYVTTFGVALILLSLALNWTRVKIRTFSDVKNNYHPSDTWIVDQNGFPLESIRNNSQKRSLDWVKWADVSPAFRDLLIHIEDRRFYSHPGIDFLALAKATWERVTKNSQRGASTLTMQLAGLLNEKSGTRRRNYREKLSQMITALKISSEWSKEEVLEAYANLVSFRGELVGLRAASLGYFAKAPSGLLKEEAALLIALLRSPNSSPELVAKRACLILELADCDSVQNLAGQTIGKSYQVARTRELVPVLSKHFTEASANTGIIQTTLDSRMQELALNALREQLRTLKNQNVNDGAALILDSRSGRVIAYVANAGTGFASANQIDGIQARRQAGSTMKPFVYAAAFDQKLLTPGSLLEDSPADISVSRGRVYHPKNYDQIFRGLVSVGDALGSSMNVPAVRALQLVGESRVLKRLQSLGFAKLHDDDFYGPSLALGAIDVTLWELTHGYRQFEIKDSAFSEETRQSIFDILSTSEHRRFTFGMNSILTLPFPAAVKTGTSKDMRDNWCIGWTSQYTVGVWVGNFNGDPMWNVSGTSGAAPIWRNLMMALHPNPKGHFAPYTPAAEELPIRTISRIRYPAQDMLVGLDPDIPPELQKLPIEIENPQTDHKLYLNKVFLSSAQEITLWPIERGKYLVELKSPSGQSIDSVNFEVR
jgi:penicillin-binding protein 1C